MDELLNRFWSEIAARPFGPMAFRFYLQPLMATLIAIRDGLNDAHQLKPAYFWALLATRAAGLNCYATGGRESERSSFSPWASI